MSARKILYKYKQFKEAKRTAEITINSLKERYKRIGADENWWIRSNLPTNVVELDILHQEDVAGKVEYLQWVMGELDRIIDAVQRATNTLNDEQRKVIDLRYFNGQTVTYICQEMNIGDNKYHYLHRTALEAMQTVLNPLCIDDEYLDMLLFTPYGERLREANRKIQVSG